MTEPMWVKSAGGPLILLPSKNLSEWLGVTGPSSESTHYDLACTIDDCAGVLDLLMCDALVLNDMPLTTTWATIPRAAGGYLVRLGVRETWEQIAQAVASLEFTEDLYYRTVGGVHRLFDSAEPGDDPEYYLDFEIDVGTYAVGTACINTPDRLMVVHRLRLCTDS